MSSTWSIAKGWHVELDREWDILGPFPVHAREQHFLSPAYPLLPPFDIADLNTPYPSSLCPSGYTSWSRTTADPDGRIPVSHPSVPWEQIRATEGWAGLQHLNVLRGWLSVYSPSTDAEGVYTDEPLLRTALVRGAFFSILPPPESPERKKPVPEWHTGNIYALSRAPAQLVKLPAPPKRSRDGRATRYEVLICGAYEIRLFGDPRAYGSPYPVLDISLSIELELSPSPPTRFPSSRNDDAHSISPHVVNGRLFGEAIGVELRSIQSCGSGCWTVVDAQLASDLGTSTPIVSLLEHVRLVSTQTRVVPLRITLPEGGHIPEDVTTLLIELTCTYSTSARSHPDTEPSPHAETFVLEVAIPLVHVSSWTQGHFTPVRATYFFARSMVTAFVAIPPRLPFAEYRGAGERMCRGNEPVLALHGAGLDILTQHLFANSLPRQKYAWIIIPQGRTEWGLDWHGPSATDAFSTVTALSRILSDLGSLGWKPWSFNPDTRVVLMGHSNGGQGAWYMAERWPDRVCGVVPAAGYIKSQAYVPWNLSRFAHFVDPFLRAVLETSLTPDDNDIFLSNLAGMPVLAIHGDADDNVPPWHTRELVGDLKTVCSGADVSYHEDPGRPHWYPEVLNNERVQAFLDRLYFSNSPGAALIGLGHAKGNCDTSQPAGRFALTVAIPSESGSMYGWRVCALIVPGLLARLEVTPTDSGRHVSVRTTNVSVFSLDLEVWVSVCNLPLENSEREQTGSVIRTIDLDGDEIVVEDRECSASGRTIWLARVGPLPPSKGIWKILPGRHTDLILRQPRQRLQAILSSVAPLTLLVPVLTSSPELSAALRIAHALRLFHALDATITAVQELRSLADVDEGNLVVVGCAGEPLLQAWLAQTGSAWKFEHGAWSFGGSRFARPASAMLFLQPHPTKPAGTWLFLQYTDLQGLERALSLFPVRTGVLSPDWIVVDGEASKVGAAGVQGAGVYACTTDGGWVWNDRVSWP